MAEVPTISSAAIQAIQDPQVREVLRAMADGIAIRNGSIGNGDAKFLTLGALTKDGLTKQAVASALAGPIADGISKPGSPMQDLADQLTDRILASSAWQSLFTRVGLIDAPDTVPGSPANLLIDEALKRGAAITKVEQTQQTAELSQSKQNQVMTAALDLNAAAISKESLVRADKDSAITQELSLYVSRTGASIAGIETDLTLKTNNDNALAKALNTFWSRVGGNTALVQTGSQILVNNVGSVVTKFEQLQAVTTDPVTGLVAKSAALRQDMELTNTSVNGLKGKWGVKLDLNGYVSGVQLNSAVSTGGQAESSFLVLADTFAVGAPGRNGIVPFAIDAQTGLVAIRGDLVVKKSITTGHIAAGSITAASGIIADLAVTTLKIGSNAVTVPMYMSGHGGLNNLGPGSLAWAGSTTAYYADDVDIVAIVNWQAMSALSGSNGNARCEIRVNGNTIAAASNSNVTNFTTSHVSTSKTRLAKGQYTFHIYFGNDWREGSWSLGYWSATLLGVMR